VAALQASGWLAAATAAAATNLQRQQPLFSAKVCVQESLGIAQEAWKRLILLKRTISAVDRVNLRHNEL
jgi:hypothetical protein